MFTVEIKFNGILAGHLYGHRTDEEQKNGKHEYKCHYYSLELQKVVKIKVRHDMKKGSRSLIAHVLTQLEKKYPGENEIEEVQDKKETDFLKKIEGLTRDG